jgi:hypothetical protein
MSVSDKERTHDRPARADVSIRRSGTCTGIAESNPANSNAGKKWKCKMLKLFVENVESS